MKREVYLDNSATTRVLEPVVKAMEECFLYEYGNPSSPHIKGIQAEKMLKEARCFIAGSLEGSEDNIIFTGSGTEANNIAIQGIARAYARVGKHLITTAIEHPSVLNTFKSLQEEGFEVTYLDVDEKGFLDVRQLEKAIRNDTILVSIMYVNNELGSVMPISSIGALLRQQNHKIIFHVDAVQAYTKLPIKPVQWNVDLVTISAHKIHGPKGIAALYVSKGVKLKPLIYGGGQEKGIRSGTENVPGAVGFAVAARCAIENMEKHVDLMRRLKRRLGEGILSSISVAHINGPSIDEGAPQILSVSFEGIRGEVLVHALEQNGIYVGTGSACSSKRQKISHVLKAIHLSKSLCEGTIRFSLSSLNTEEDIDYTINVLNDIVPLLIRFKRR